MDKISCKLVEYDSALTNELRTVVIHSRSVYSQTRSAILAIYQKMHIEKSERSKRGIVGSRENRKYMYSRISMFRTSLEP